MQQLPAFVIPLVGNPASNNSVKNALNGADIVIPKNATVQFPVGTFIGPQSSGAMVTDLSNLVTAEMVLRSQSTTSDPAAGATLIYDKVIPASQFNPSLTYAQFQTGLLGHFTFTMSSADTNQLPGTYYLAFGVTTTNAGNIPLGFSTTITIQDYGIFTGGTPSTPTAISYTEQESDARYQLQAASIFVPGISSVGDGAAGSLEAVPTTGLSTPNLRTFYNVAADDLENWLLWPSTTAVTGGLVQLPNDYNVSTNAKAWFRK